MSPRLPAAATAALSSACAVWAAGQVLGMDALTRAALLALSLGHLSAAAAHRRPVAALRYAALAALAVLAYQCFRPAPPEALAAYAEVLHQRSSGAILVALVYAVVFLSFVAGAGFRGRRAPMVTPTVPALSIYGLAGVFSSGPGIQTSFFGFVFGAVYTMAHEHRLAQQEAAGAPPGPAVTAALGVTAAYLAVLLPLALPLSALSQRLAPGLSSAERDDLRRMLLAAGEDPGYSRFSDTVGLGGGVHSTGEQPLMRIYAKGATMVRGRVYDVYEANHWACSASMQSSRALAPRPRQGAREMARGAIRNLALPEESEERPEYGPRRRFRLSLPAEILPPPTCARRIPHRVQILGKVPGSVYCDGVPVEVTTTRADLAVSQAGVVSGDVDWQRGDEYQAVSLVPDVPETLLRRAGSSRPKEDGPWWQIPASVTPVRDLAARIAGSERTPYARAEAISEYLRRHCEYSLSAPTVPQGEDAVCFFLTTGRKGACDLFAGSMTVLCRCVGVPARLATGYLLNETEEDGAFVVRERDAHAWVEVYVAAYGWVALDPTPAGDAPARHSPVRAALRWWDRVSPRTLAFLAEGLLLCMALGALLRVRGGSRFHDPAARWRPGPGDARGGVQQAYHQACRHLARRGIPRTPGQTPVEYLDALAAAGVAPEAHQTMAELTRLFESACYAPASAPVPDARAARSLAASVRRLPRELRRSKT